MLPRDTIVSLGPRKPTRAGMNSEQVLDRVFDENWDAWIEFLGELGFYWNKDDGTYYREGDR